MIRPPLSKKGPHMIRSILWPFVVLSFLVSAGCGSGGGSSGGGPAVPPPLAGAASGQLNVPPGNELEIEPNDTVLQAQAAALSSIVAGRASETDSGFQLPSGNRIQDLYRLTASEQVRVVLTIAEDDRLANDLDLFLLDSNGVVLQVSEARNTGIELLETGAGGTYLIGIRAFAGSSAYTISFRTLSSLPSDAGIEIFPPGVEIVPGEVVVKRKAAPTKQAPDSAAFALKHGLTRSGQEPSEIEMMTLDPSETAAEELSRKSTGSSSLRQNKERHPTSEQNGLRSRTYDSIRRLRLDPDVDYAHSNYRLKPRLIPNDTSYPIQWHYDQVFLAEAWDITTGSDSIIVAVIDTGVVDHPDLQARIIAGYDFISDPAVAGDGNGRDPDPTDAGDDASGPGRHSYHGTHVAGTIGAVTNNGVGVAGVTWQTKIMPLRVLGKGGGSSFDLAEALKYAAGLPNISGTLPPQRAHVINMSLGACAQNPTERLAIEAARSAGVILVAAAGNNRAGEPGCPAGTLEYPASYDGVVSVAAVDILQNPARYSSFGPRIDVAAPGGDLISGTDVNGDGNPDGVLSTWRNSLTGQNGYAFANGTSMATPHVTGIVALMLAVNPRLTALDFKLLLAGTHQKTMRRITRDLGPPARDNDTGHGLLNAAQAVRAALEVDGGPQSSAPILTVSTSQLNFDTGLDVITFSVNNAGSGTLFVNSVTGDVPWLIVTPPSGTAPFSLRARVDRGGLPPGTHTGRITIASNTSQNPQAIVDVTVKAGGVGAGNVGSIFVLILAAQTFTTLEATETSIGQDYGFAIPAIPPGSYIVVAGTDRDNNGFICEEEDACGIYPDLITITSGQNTPAINFTVANFVTSPAGLQTTLTGLSGVDVNRIFPLLENSKPVRLQRPR
jgi:serine protease